MVINWLSISFLLLPTIGGSAHNFSHGKGVDLWPVEFCSQNEGRQSPININTSSTLPCSVNSMLNLNEYSKTVNLEAINNGHTVKFKLIDQVLITEGGLNGRYHLLQFHFHWGSSDEKGSEHTIDRKKYSLEVHFVHQAMDDPNPLHKYAVISVLFTVGKSNKGIEKLESVFRQLLKPNFEDVTEEVIVKNFTLESLLPIDKSFYRYAGSFTTPTCNEIVVWSVMQTTIAISSEQLTKYRSLLDEHGHSIVNNFRPVQKINERSVFNCRRNQEEIEKKVLIK